MNAIDIILLIPLVYGLISGFKNGLVREVAIIVGIIAGIYFARYFSDDLATLLVETLGWKISVCLPLSYALIFLAVMVALQFVAMILGKLLKFTGIGSLNHLLGGLFGVLKYALILSLILNFLLLIKPFVPVSEKPAVKESKLYEPIQKVIPTILPFIHYEAYKDKVQHLFDVCDK